jgi:hypothetical protein
VRVASTYGPSILRPSQKKLGSWALRTRLPRSATLAAVANRSGPGLAAAGAVAAPFPTQIPLGEERRLYCSLTLSAGARRPTEGTRDA